MARSSLVFLGAGFLYGALLGYGLPYLYEHRPWARRTEVQASGPMGPQAPTSAGGAPAAGAQEPPMLREVAALKERIRDNPADLRALQRLANLYHDAAMYEQAIEYYHRALELKPDDPDLRTDLGVCLQATGRHEEALAAFAEAQRADPQHWQSVFNTVVVAGLHLRRFDEAQRALARLEQLQPELPQLADLRRALEQAQAAAAAERP